MYFINMKHEYFYLFTTFIVHLITRVQNVTIVKLLTYEPNFKMVHPTQSDLTNLSNLNILVITHRNYTRQYTQNKLSCHCRA